MLKDTQLACDGNGQAYSGEASVRTVASEIGWVTSQHSEVFISGSFPYFSDPVKSVDVPMKCPQVNTSGRDIWHPARRPCSPSVPRALGGEASPIFCIMMGTMALQELPSAGLEPAGSVSHLPHRTESSHPPHPSPTLPGSAVPSPELVQLIKQITNQDVGQMHAADQLQPAPAFAANGAPATNHGAVEETLTWGF